jgi:NADPH:quinone reductase-like Zn-dependent oxidoreductase
MKAIQIASTGGPEILESEYVGTRKQLTTIMDAFFGMYLSKDLEVLIRPMYALEDAAEAHRYLGSRKSTGNLVSSIGG